MRSVTKLILLALVAGVLALTGGCGEQPAALDTEQAPAIEEAEPRVDAPDFTVPLIGGGEASLSDYEGKILVLDFWATWCAACVKEFPAYQELYSGWDHDEVEYLGLSADGDMTTVQAFLKGRPEITMPMGLASDELMDAYLPTRTLPSSRVIDADGVVRYEFKGAGVEKVREAVRRLLEEQDGGSASSAADDPAE